MNIQKAKMDNLELINGIVHSTINKIYPDYYTQEVVDFFNELHSKESISKDIINGNVYIFGFNEMSFGTVTLIDNCVKRLFIIPEFQGNGYGSGIMEFIEEIVSKDYEEIILDSSLPSFKFYTGRDYSLKESYTLELENGKILFYEQLYKIFK